MLRNDLKAYTRALWKHWKTLVSGVGSILLSAVSAYLKIPLPYWSFWIVAIGFFFVASFLVWRDESQARHAAESKMERLQVPKYTADRKRLAHADLDRLEKSDQPWHKILLRELLVRGQMDEAHASGFLISKGYAHLSGSLNALQFHTSFVVHDSVGQYSVNPDMLEALTAALDEREGS
jgi:hypothetical protein